MNKNNALDSKKGSNFDDFNDKMNVPKIDWIAFAQDIFLYSVLLFAWCWIAR